MGELQGLVCAVGAAVAFGVQYVPVKRYEIFDGATFQWFMCSGILMLGFLIALLSGNIGEGAGCSRLIMLGGALWALSNCFVLPLVKLLGIGLGFSLYHFVNLMVGYAVGRFGLFGVPRLEGDLVLCDLGCCLILVSFVVMVFVEVEDDTAKRKGSDDTTAPAAPSPSPPSCSSGGGSSKEGRETCGFLPLGGDAHDVLNDKVGILSGMGSVMFGLSSAECGGPHHQYQSVGGFSCLSTPRTSGDCEDCQRDSISDPGLCASGSLVERLIEGEVERLLQGRAAAVGSSGALERLRLRLAGVALAVAGGGLCGVQSVPAALHNASHPGESPLAVVFPQCLGIWAASSLLYITYSTVARLCGWPVPHAAIRPAYASGCVWCAGFAFMIAGIHSLGYSVGYTLDAVGPIVVSSLLSLLVFKEISGAEQVALYFAAFTLQLIGVLLIAGFGRAAA